MKVITTITILLAQSLVLAGCGGGEKPNQVKTLKKQAVEIEEFIQKSQHEKDGDMRRDEVFMQLGKKMTYEEFQDYVARISDDDPTNDEGVQ